MTTAPTVPTADTALADLHWAVFDTETTGFSPTRKDGSAGDGIVELCILRVDSTGRTLDRFTTLLDPGRDVGPTAIHRITQAMVADAPRFSQVAGQVASILDGAVPVAHNAGFDEKFLRAALAAAGADIAALPMLCTIQLTDHLLLDRIANRKLVTCAAKFGLPLDGAHAAYVDVRATAALLAGYLRIAAARGATTLADIARCFLGDAGVARITATDRPGGRLHNRPEVAALLDEPYPQVPSDAILEPFCPPDAGRARQEWLDRLERYRSGISCPKCGEMTAVRTRKRDAKKFRACTAWRRTGCRWTADIPDAA